MTPSDPVHFSRYSLSSHHYPAQKVIETKEPTDLAMARAFDTLDTIHIYPECSEFDTEVDISKVGVGIKVDLA